MIKCDMGNVEISGPNLSKKAELATLIHTMVRDNHLPKHDIIVAFYDGIEGGDADRNKKEESVEKENTSEKVEKESADDFDSIVLINALFDC